MPNTGYILLAKPWRMSNYYEFLAQSELSYKKIILTKPLRCQTIIEKSMDKSLKDEFYPALTNIYGIITINSKGIEIPEIENINDLETVCHELTNILEIHNNRIEDEQKIQEREYEKRVRIKKIKSKLTSRKLRAILGNQTAIWFNKPKGK